MTRHVPPTTLRLADEQLERAHRDTTQRIVDLQGMPSAGLEVVSSVTLKNNSTTAVAHPLGRFPSFVSIGVPRGATSAGYFTEVRDGSVDRKRYLNIKAAGFGADVVVDIVVL